MQIFEHNWLEIVLRVVILLIQAFTALSHSVSLFTITLSMKLMYPSLTNWQTYCEMSLVVVAFLLAVFIVRMLGSTTSYSSAETRKYSFSTKRISIESNLN